MQGSVKESGGRNGLSLGLEEGILHPGPRAQLGAIAEEGVLHPHALANLKDFHLRRAEQQVAWGVVTQSVQAQKVISGHQWSSVVISGHQWSSVVVTQSVQAPKVVVRYALAPWGVRLPFPLALH